MSYLSRKHAIGTLARAMQRLPPELRQAFVLVYVDGSERRAAAEQLGITHEELTVALSEADEFGVWKLRDSSDGIGRYGELRVTLVIDILANITAPVPEISSDELYAQAGVLV